MFSLLSIQSFCNFVCDHPFEMIVYLFSKILGPFRIVQHYLIIFLCFINLLELKENKNAIIHVHYDCLFPVCFCQSWKYLTFLLWIRIIVSLQNDSIEMFRWFVCLYLLIYYCNALIQFLYFFTELFFLLLCTFMFYLPQNIIKNMSINSYFGSQDIFKALIFKFLRGKVGKVDIQEVNHFFNRY